MSPLATNLLSSSVNVALLPAAYVTSTSAPDRSSVPVRDRVPLGGVVNTTDVAICFCWSASAVTSTSYWIDKLPYSIVKVCTLCVYKSKLEIIKSFSTRIVVVPSPYVANILISAVLYVPSY